MSTESKPESSGNAKRELTQFLRRRTAEDEAWTHAADEGTYHASDCDDELCRGCSSLLGEELVWRPR